MADDNIIVLPARAPVEVSTRGNVRCGARRSNGEPCRKWAIRGGTVCPTHGGSAPQVQRGAKLRLLELVDPAIARLAREMDHAEFSSDRQRAANSILDRAGIVRQNGVEADLARALLIDRLIAFMETGQ